MGIKKEVYKDGVLVDTIDTTTKEDRNKNILLARKAQYGTVEEQIEYAVENGFEALRQRNLNIKTNLPFEV